MAQELCVVVSDEDRVRLEAIIGDRTRPVKHVQRARIVLLSAERLPVLQVAGRAGVSRPAVWRWQRRYAEAGVTGLLRDKTRAPGKKPVAIETVNKVLALTCGDPPGEMTHWTGRAMAKTVSLALHTVQRIWRANRLQPHRLRTFKRSSDPALAEKVEDIVGLYMHPPAHAVVLSIDEKSQIQALDRTQPGLPIKPGKTMTHDYKRHSTTTCSLPSTRSTVSCMAAACSAYPPGIHPLPQHRRARRTGRQTGSRHSRQLRHPQASQGQSLARPPPALGLSLHPNLRVLAQCG